VISGSCVCERETETETENLPSCKFCSLRKFQFVLHKKSWDSWWPPLQLFCGFLLTYSICEPHPQSANRCLETSEKIKQKCGYLWVPCVCPPCQAYMHNSCQMIPISLAPCVQLCTVKCDISMVFLLQIIKRGGLWCS
jgi:hypothetical protein